MKTAPTNKKVRELISLVRDGKIIPKPEFQRRLVWTRDDKNLFLDSVLRGYPFPEIYLADGDVDLETGEGTQLLVDGLQRVSTLIQYFNGDPDLKLTTVPYYRDLSDADKQAFLQYDVAVRDLGSVLKSEVVEVFRRINATKYSLREIEINNAIYVGELKKFCERLSANNFFVENQVFTPQDFKRMGDLRYALGIVVTILGGYSNRDDVFVEYLDRFNDDFPEAEIIESRVQYVFDFIDECGFDSGSRIWRKADLFTAIVEFDRILNIESIPLQPQEVLERLSEFFGRMDSNSVKPSDVAAIYYKATLQASNDRVNRMRRGIIFAGIVKGEKEAAILSQVRPEGPAQEQLPLGPIN